jgi:hypothetical protein
VSAFTDTDRAGLRLGIAGIGLLGPGLADWDQGRAVLAEPARWDRQPTVVPPPARLPATERRRAGLVVKAAVTVADQAIAGAGADPAALATVFSSSTGDPANCHAMCEALAAPERLVSPTRFTNSVHNAAAGYWHIAAGSRQPSTSLGAYDESFTAGLLEAATQCAAGGQPVLLVACDLPYPEPLHALRPVDDVFACALLLTPPGMTAPRRLQLRLAGDDEADRCAAPALEALRQGNPAARALPLLQALARPAASTVTLAGQPGWSLALDLDPVAA